MCGPLHFLSSNLQKSDLPCAFVLSAQVYRKPCINYEQKSDLDTLPQVLTSEPEKRVSILHSFKKALLPLVDKSSVSHTITHKAFYDFFQHCDDQTVREVCPPVNSFVVSV